MSHSRESQEAYRYKLDSFEIYKPTSRPTISIIDSHLNINKSTLKCLGQPGAITLHINEKVSKLLITSARARESGAIQTNRRGVLRISNCMLIKLLRKLGKLEPNVSYKFYGKAMKLSKNKVGVVFNLKGVSDEYL